jgi:AP-2 complex subunit alpha
MIPCPWLQVKLLRLLQYYPIPEDTKLKDMVYNIIDRLISNSVGIKSSKEKKSQSKVNASQAILFEALNLAISYDE